MYDVCSEVGFVLYGRQRRRVEEFWLEGVGQPGEHLREHGAGRLLRLLRLDPDLLLGAAHVNVVVVVVVVPRVSDPALGTLVLHPPVLEPDLNLGIYSWLISGLVQPNTGDTGEFTKRVQDMSSQLFRKVNTWCMVQILKRVLFLLSFSSF